MSSDCRSGRTSGCTLVDCSDYYTLILFRKLHREWTSLLFKMIVIGNRSVVDYSSNRLVHLIKTWLAYAPIKANNKLLVHREHWSALPCFWNSRLQMYGLKAWLVGATVLWYITVPTLQTSLKNALVLSIYRTVSWPQ